jgi:hypothetical protein
MFGQALALTLLFAFTNGIHDASNAIAALVATRGARPLQAVVLAASIAASTRRSNGSSLERWDGRDRGRGRRARALRRREGDLTVGAVRSCRGRSRGLHGGAMPRDAGPLAP